MQVNDHVRVVAGSGSGLEGRIAAIDELTGWIHIRVDDHPNLEGPFTPKELELQTTGRRLRTRNAQPPIPETGIG